VHFVPDVYGDFVFNDVAADVTRESLLNGIQFDAAYQLDDRHKLRAGFAVSAETTAVANIQTVLPVTPSGTVLPSPFNVEQRNSLIGRNVGGYIQDEWKITDQFVLNTGLDQYVNANQFSPRVRLQAVRRGHHHSCRLCPLFHPADAGPGDPGELGAGDEHDRSAGSSDGRQGAAGALALLRCRPRPEAAARPSGDSRDYLPGPAEGQIDPPKWPEGTLTDWLKEAFFGRIVDNDEHEFMIRLRGL
jgi:hypothetical protein